MNARKANIREAHVLSSVLRRQFFCRNVRFKHKFLHGEIAKFAVIITFT